MYRSSRSPGQSMVEFALIAPLLFLLLFGIIELGLMLNIYIGLTNSAREAARAGAVYQYTVPASGVASAAVIDTQRDLQINAAILQTLNPMISSSTLTVTVSYPTVALATNAYRARETVVVSLAHDHKLFFGILGPQKMTLSATSAMRIEPGAAR